ncbi:hypothetical protein CRE_09830 [Caenorhabditis remanei]|uniref:Uncharacterized protein n=1 Tax=Caenorhabditis remanei TaxID=31234 RepID=E3NG50_CAERE|nr:hypothetical protein CRE_09830 [Caenorhabditis remanei]
MNATRYKPPELMMVCANEVQLAQRNSIWFQLNVGANTILAIGTFVTSAKYWSLIRALLYHDQPCKIMFNEYECFPYYSLNILSRLMMITLYCAQTFNMLVIGIYPSLPESKIRGFALVAIALLSSVGLCEIITNDGPNDNIQGNCLQRQGRNLDELKEQLFTYLRISFGVFVASNVALGLTYWRMKNKSNSTVSKKYQSIANYNASIVLSVVTALVMIALGVYSYATAYIVDHVKEIDPVNVGLWSMWLYTYTIAEFVLPAALLLIPAIIKKQRKSKVAALTAPMTPAEEQAKYFKSLANDWDAELARKYPELAPVA